MISRFVLAGLATALLIPPADAANESPPLPPVVARETAAGPPATSPDKSAEAKPKRTRHGAHRHGRVAAVESPAEEQAPAEQPIKPLFPFLPAPKTAAAPYQTGSVQQPAVQPATVQPATGGFNLFGALFGARPAEPAPAMTTGRPQIDALVSHHAKLNGVPESLVHRIIVRESKYNPRAVGRGGAMGLMQIKTATARGMGYTGGPAGLLDAETNITYAVKYLAGAYRTAGGNPDRAVSYYASGYFYAAKRLDTGKRLTRGQRQEANAVPAESPPEQPRSLFSFMAPSR